MASRYPRTPWNLGQRLEVVVKPRLGVCLGNWLPARVLQKAAKLAEERGYDTFWITESSTGHGKDAPSQMAALALATSKIRLGTAVMPIFTRTPTLIAQVATSMDEISNGRFVLGIGSSHGPTLLNNHGIVQEKPFQRLRESLFILREVMRKGEISHQGEIFNIPDLKLLVPNPERHIPIYLAALAPRTAELAGRMADGVIINMAGPEYVGELASRLKQAASDAGRDPTSVDIACLVLACGDEARAEKVCSYQIAFYLRMPFYQNHLKRSGFAPEVEKITKGIRDGSITEAAKSVSTRMLDTLALVGNAKHWPARLQLYRQAGATLPCPFFFQSGPKHHDAILKGIGVLSG